MKTKFYLKIILAALVLPPLTGWSETPVHAFEPVAAPPFRISNLDGKRFDSRSFQGQPLVLSFFYTACVPCLKEMPLLYEFMKKNGKLEQLLFVDSYVPGAGIEGDADTELKIRKFAERLKIPTATIYHDLVGTLAKKFSGAGAFPQARKMGVLLTFPSIVVLDRHGRIAYVLEGSRETFLEEIQPLIQETGG